MDEGIKHRIKQQYNRLSALLVFIANAFTLMYVGGMVYNDALWFGSVSGADASRRIHKPTIGGVIGS